MNQSSIMDYEKLFFLFFLKCKAMGLRNASLLFADVWFCWYHQVVIFNSRWSSSQPSLVSCHHLPTLFATEPATAAAKLTVSSVLRQQDVMPTWTTGSSVKGMTLTTLVEGFEEKLPDTIL